MSSNPQSVEVNAMNNKCMLYVRKVLDDQRGQVLPWVTSMMLVLLGMAGLTVDVGRAFVMQRQLQYSTNAAALAGAGTLPNSPTSVADNYSSKASGDSNFSALMGTVTTTVTPKCLTTLTKAGLLCGTPTDANAVQVTQTLALRTTFMNVFSIINPAMSTINLKAVATAAEAGGTPQAANIAILQDTTASMNDADNGSNCSGTQITCSLQGMITLLQSADPCGKNITCVASTSDPLEVQNSIDTVSLFVFPAVTTATESNDSTCPTSNPTIVPYTFQNVTAASPNYTQPATATYQIVGWSGNYRPSDTSPLDPSSQIVIAAGGGSCSGIKSPGGEATYYAQAINATQAALVALAAQQAPTLNGATPPIPVIIILSDGDATACATNANTAADACNSAGDLTATVGHLNGTTTASGCTAANNCSPTGTTYPSAVGECGQAVQASANAAAAGTRIYTIGYGALTSGGCTTDKLYSASVTSGGGSWSAGDQPCAAIAAMASDPHYFYSDQGQGCVSALNSGASLSNITGAYNAIIAGLTNPVLIPNSTT
jgi:hypothetical protein